MTTIIWKGIFYNSLEYFQLLEIEETVYAKSKIIGTYANNIYFADYTLEIDKEWRVFSFHIEFEVNNEKKTINGIKKNNEWNIDGKIDSRFRGFEFIDISITPSTNTLPIRNLQLSNGEEKEISVIYLNILDNIIKPVKQKYRKNSDTNFSYENIPNDFEADIDVDLQGLATFYTSLFVRVTENQKNDG